LDKTDDLSGIHKYVNVQTDHGGVDDAGTEKVGPVSGGQSSQSGSSKSAKHVGSSSKHAAKHAMSDFIPGVLDSLMGPITSSFNPNHDLVNSSSKRPFKHTLKSTSKRNSWMGSADGFVNLVDYDATGDVTSFQKSDEDLSS
jgi:hypothetical protein